MALHFAKTCQPALLSGAKIICGHDSMKGLLVIYFYNCVYHERPVMIQGLTQKIGVHESGASFKMRVYLRVDGLNMRSSKHAVQCAGVQAAKPEYRSTEVTAFASFAISTEAPQMDIRIQDESTALSYLAPSHQFASSEIERLDLDTGMLEQYSK